MLLLRCLGEGISVEAASQPAVCAETKLFPPAYEYLAPTVEDGQVVQGAIESSNVLPMEELVSLIQVARAYEASQRSMLSHDDLISKAINSLGSTTA